MALRCPGLAVVLTLGLTLTGCQSQGGHADRRVQVGGTVNYGSFGTRITLDCAEGKSLNIGGSNNVLSVLGSCGSVSIGGADNTVTIDRIDGELSVVGINNTVYYRDGDPRISDSGVGNRIGRK